MNYSKYVGLSWLVASVGLAAACGNEPATSGSGSGGAAPQSNNGGDKATSSSRSETRTSSSSTDDEDSGGGTDGGTTKNSTTAKGGTSSRASSNTKASTGKGGTSTKTSGSQGRGGGSAEGGSSDGGGGEGNGGASSPGDGGEGDGGSSQGEGGSSTTGEGSSAGGAGGTNGSTNTSEMACEHLSLPNDKADFLDFSTFNDKKEWGATTGDAAGLTGGTSLYNGTGDEISVDASSGKLVATMSLAPLGYAGITFWFGPCLDVSGYTGVSFSVSSDVSFDLVSKFMVQTYSDYPIDKENKKGACAFTDDAKKWDECVSPSFTFTMSDTEEVQKIPFAELKGGKPNDGVDASELVGVQYQFECASENPCVFTVTLDNISFYK